MTKDVLVSISGLQMALDDMVSNNDEPIEVISAGNYYFKNGKHFVFLEEMAEGMQEITKTQIKWEDAGNLEVTKKGLSNVHMVFEKNKKNRCYYNTPFGQLNLGIFMTEMSVKEAEDSISIVADYALDVNNEPLAECCIRIHICPRNAENFSISERMT